MIFVLSLAAVGTCWAAVEALLRWTVRRRQRRLNLTADQLDRVVWR